MADTPAVQETSPATSIDRMEMFHSAMLQRAMAQEAQTRPGGLGKEIAARNMDQIFAATEKDDVTDEDIWNAGTGSTIQGREAFNEDGGLELRIYGYRPDVSTRTFEEEENPKGYYVTLEASVIGGPASLLRKLGVEVGQEVAVQTGADDVIFRLRAFEMRDRFPIDAVISGVKTSKDNHVIKLRPLPTRAVSGAVVK